jgi:hypothetical protein
MSGVNTRLINPVGQFVKRSHSRNPALDALDSLSESMTPDEPRDIDSAFSKVPVHGHRYSEQAERMIDR